MTQAEEDLPLAQENKLILEEYKIWKKNAPYLYDLVVTHALEWPSLTVQWLPDVEIEPSKNSQTQRLILGTHTDGSAEDPNYLMIASVTLPLETQFPDHRPSAGSGTVDHVELGGYGERGTQCKISVTNRILHTGEVNRARYMPQNPCLIATRSVDSNVYVFDYTKHPSHPTSTEFKPDIVLQGHTREGFGMDWNPLKNGHLATCANDEIICLWDISKFSRENRTLSPVLQLTSGHSSVVEVFLH